MTIETIGPKTDLAQYSLVELCDVLFGKGQKQSIPCNPNLLTKLALYLELHDKTNETLYDRAVLGDKPEDWIKKYNR